ncbi:DUF1934 domain-containing protein [Clostridium paraputrificum]|uniref:DUF1934 domain-containing protein n=1 Tax=Clostridium TaxID=1485 RepID=UPI003D33EFA9
MEKKAIISVKSNASMEDGDIIEVVSPGKYIKLDDEYKAIYEETEISGMEGTLTTLTIRDNEVILEREGTTSTKMLFNEKEPSVALYNTPYGMLEISISTNKLNVNIDDEGGELNIEYDMAVSGQKPLKTSLYLKVRTQKED